MTFSRYLTFMKSGLYCEGADFCRYRRSIGPPHIISKPGYLFPTIFLILRQPHGADFTIYLKKLPSTLSPGIIKKLNLQLATSLNLHILSRGLVVPIPS